MIPTPREAPGADDVGPRPLVGRRPAERLAVDRHARFMRLVEEYVDLMTGITEEEAARAKDDE